MSIRIKLLAVLFWMAALTFLSLAAGFYYSSRAASKGTLKAKEKIVYPKKTQLDFEGLQIDGELNNPGEFYFKLREPEKFDSLIRRRKSFHREMLRDVVLSK